MESFSKNFPSMYEVILSERNEYMTQSIDTLTRLVTMEPGSKPFPRKVLVVCGLAHVKGIEKQLCDGQVAFDRMNKISTSSRHPRPTWSHEALPIADADKILSTMSNNSSSSSSNNNESKL